MMNEFALVEHESYSALIQSLERSHGSPILLGKDAESQLRFYSIRTSGGLEVGIASSGFGISPSAVALNERCVFVGYDCSVSGIDLRSKQILFELSLAAPFYQFLPCSEGDSQLIVYELGLLKLSMDGKVVWIVETEIIEDFRKERELVTIKAMDVQDLIVVNTDTGKII